MNVLSRIANRPDALESAHYLCWTRMQAEAGQALNRIVQRKEHERRRGDGLFFWGVGNAPSKLIRPLSRAGVRVPVVFSVMKSKPKAEDSTPSALVIWNGFIDSHGAERDIPEHVVVTSRRDSASGPKTAHYALVCRSGEPLALRSGVPFAHRRFRNAGAEGGPIGASQVTALLEPDWDECDPIADYEQNLVAELAEGFWVRLTRPAPIAAEFAAMNLAEADAYARAIRADAMRERPLPATSTLL